MKNMENEVAKEEYKNHNISIQYDMDSENPRNWDNICIIHLAHKRYSFGDKNHNSLESVQEAEREALANGDIVLPFYMYDHSGITISLSPFSCPWDSGRAGFVQVPKDKMIKEFGKKSFTAALKKKALEVAKGEIETLDSYIRGEVYGFVIDDNTESCWGFYSVKEAMDEAKSLVDHLVDVKIAV